MAFEVLNDYIRLNIFNINSFVSNRYDIVDFLLSVHWAH